MIPEILLKNLTNFLLTSPGTKVEGNEIFWIPLKPFCVTIGVVHVSHKPEFLNFRSNISLNIREKSKGH